MITIIICGDVILLVLPEVVTASKAYLELPENFRIVVGKMTNQRLQDTFVSEHSALHLSHFVRRCVGSATAIFGSGVAA